VPARSAAIAGRSASMARWRSKRSMNTVPASAKAGPKSGFLRTSRFATATMSRRRSLQRRIVSTALWWLKTKTAGRCDQRCSSPRTARCTPASAVPSSPHAVIARFTMSRRLRLSTPGIAGEGVATAAVGLTEPAGLGVDRGRDRAREDALGELLELLLGDVAQPRRRRRDESREADAAELEAEAVQQRVDDVARGHPAAEQPVAQEGDGREAGDERAVDVEEGPHPGSGGALVDVVHDVGGERHGGGRRDDTSAAVARSSGPSSRPLACLGTIRPRGCAPEPVSAAGRS